ILIAVYIFTLFGTTSGDFFCPNLASISKMLRMSETVAGVTLAALGNGAPDIFSTFSAMRAGAAGLAIGELLGAALFITLVVVGVVSLVATSTTLPSRPFTRDMVCLIATVCIILYVIFDGKVTFGESVTLIFFYVAYVLTVVVGNLIYRRRKAAQLMLEAATQLLRNETQGDFEPAQDAMTPQNPVPPAEPLFVPHLTSVQFPFLVGYEAPHITPTSAYARLATDDTATTTLLDADPFPADPSSPVVTASPATTTRMTFPQLAHRVSSWRWGPVPLGALLRFLFPTLFDWTEMNLRQRVWGVLTGAIIGSLRSTIPVVHQVEVEAAMTKAGGGSGEAAEVSTLLGAGGAASPMVPLSIGGEARGGFGALDDLELEWEDELEVAEDSGEAELKTWSLILQCVCAPQFLFVTAMGSGAATSVGGAFMLWGFAVAASGVLGCVAYIVFRKPEGLGYCTFLAGMGFVMAVTWIYVFAFGNSIGGASK
ncbi:hypothetical protein HK101_001114, partial [Irineochytrium annulatum]